MFYEIKFKLGLPQSERANLSSISLPIVEKMQDAAIIFDEYKNCLFLNQAAEELLVDRPNISAIGDWIRSQIEDISSAEMVFQLAELPISLAELERSQPVEIVLTKKHFSAEFCQQLNQHKSLPIRELKIKPNYTYDNAELPPENFFKNPNHDSLTGLPNYSLLFESIEQEISFCQQRLGYEFVILFVDVNRFKAINSSLGRTLGDRLLIAISQRLQSCLRARDFIARMGNDEFVILLSNVEHLSYATNVAERIYRELAIPFNLAGYDVFIEASIGIAVGNNEYTKPEYLLRDAELAVSDAKRQSQLPYQIFNQSDAGESSNSTSVGKRST